MPILPVNGLQMHYEHLQPINTSKPKAPPVLLLAGMASDSTSWQPLIAGLQANHELLIPDNRCTGRSRPIPIETSRQLMVEDMLALLDNLDIERINIIGHSMGAMLGWALAAQEPMRVSKLICASALPTIIPARISLFESLAVIRNDNNEAHWFELFYQFLFSPKFFNNTAIVKATVAASQGYAYKQSEAAFSEQVKGLKSFMPELDISQLHCPITMITGSNDVLMTPQMQQQFAHINPHVKTHVIDEAAHAIHWEQAEEFLSLALDALSSEH